jgi:hypothetical protein
MAVGTWEFGTGVVGGAVDLAQCAVPIEGFGCSIGDLANGLMTDLPGTTGQIALQTAEAIGQTSKDLKSGDPYRVAKSVTGIFLIVGTIGAARAPAAGSVRVSEGATLRRADDIPIGASAPSPRTMFHYTDEAGQSGIVRSGRLNASLARKNPRDVRYGEGQYLSDIRPGTRSPSQLSRQFIGQPFQGRRFTHYVEIDVAGLKVVQGRDGVYVIPNTHPLDVAERIVSYGAN